MFGGKGRALLAVLIVFALAIPAVSALANSAAAGASAAPAAADPGAAGDLNWTLVHQAPAGVFYYTMYFPTKDVGYVTGGPDWNAADDNSRPIAISKTTDGGKSWVTTDIPNTAGWARGLTCTDPNNCWVAGNNAIRILRTTDGGKNWTSFSNASGYTKFLWSAGFTKNGSTILSGTTCYDPDPVEGKGATANWLRSTDGQTFSGVQATPGTYMCYVQYDIECPSAGYCYSAGKNYVWRSQNDGQTWARTSPTTPGDYRWYGLSCTSKSNCWLSGKWSAKGPNPYPYIMSTTNSGAGWGANLVVGLGTSSQFWDLAMVDDTHGYAVGCDSVATDVSDACLGKGMIYRTDDGVTWNRVGSVPDAKDFVDIWAFSMDDIYVVDFAGKIWHGVGAPPPTATPTATATPSTGVVAGFTFNDLNGDALQDNGESGIGGATLVLRQGRNEIATVVSSADGAFRFDGIAPGQYTVEEKTAPAGFTRSPFLGTFRIEANRDLIFFLPHDAITETSTPTPTETAAATEAPTATPTVEPTATPTATGTRAASAPWGYLPIIVQ